MSVPHGALVELTTDLIDEGHFLKELDAAIRHAHDALKQRHERGEIGGACTIQATVKIGYDKNSNDLIEIRTSVVTKTPKNERVSQVKEKGGVLLCQPSGSNDDTPDQQRLFDAQGRVMGAIDKKTGELIEEKAIAGRVGQKA